MPRTILHLDLDAFFCAVEELRDPSLRGKAFAVGGRPEVRGVVSSCSYAARGSGVRSAMPMAKALALCPGLTALPPRFAEYRAASAGVMARLHSLTPLVEQLSIDEAFLDVGDLPLSGELVAARLQAEIREELGLPCSLGVATNKLVAKVATDVGKAEARGGGPPNAIRVVRPGEEAEFLAPLPALALWGVGAKTAERLAGLGLRTIGDIARWPEASLVSRFGKHGRMLSRHARGIDERPIITTHAAKGISKETTFERDTDDRDTLLRTLCAQAGAVSRQLRREGLAGSTVRLKLRWPDFTTLTRQATLQQPTSREDVIAATATRLFEQIWEVGRPVRLLGVGVSGLAEPLGQLSLWDAARGAEDTEKARRLRATVDALRDRHGRELLRWASEAPRG